MTQVHDDGLSEWNLLWTPDQSHCRDGLSTFSLPTAGKEANHLTLTQISNQNASNLGAVDNPTGCHRFPSLSHSQLRPSRVQAYYLGPACPSLHLPKPRVLSCSNPTLAGPRTWVVSAPFTSLGCRSHTIHSTCLVHKAIPTCSRRALPHHSAKQERLLSPSSPAAPPRPTSKPCM